MSAGSSLSDELQRLLDATVAQLTPLRRTFDDDEALHEIWAQGYDIGPQHDARFVLVQEGRGARRPRQWRLVAHTLADNLLLEELLQGTWDGRDLEDALVRFDDTYGGHHVFCPFDPRFTRRPDGTIEATDQEPEVALDPAFRKTLDGLAAALLDPWIEAGGQPRTVRQLAEVLGDLGWSGAGARGTTVKVRAWLRDRADIARTGQDYWVPAGALPGEPARTRLQVLPVISHSRSAPSSSPDEPAAIPGIAFSSPADITLGEVPAAGAATPSLATWTQILRTIHLLEGFLPVPKVARAAFPPRAPGAGRWEALRGTWYDSADAIWLWLDREAARLAGRDLADHLAWCSAGERLRITWAPEGIVIRTAGIDEAVQQQETRLVDLEALAALRGGLGESYRQSILAILGPAQEGMSFRDLASAVGARQGHKVHPGTLRAVLSAGGFVQRDGRWRIGPQPEIGGRQLRYALLRTLQPQDDAMSDLSASAIAPTAALKRSAETIRARLQALQDEWRALRVDAP